MSTLNRFLEAFLKSPLVWGGLSGAAFFGLVHSGVLGPEFFQRYCAGHPVEYVETVLFFVGMGVLGIKALEIAGQKPGLRRVLLGPVPRGGQTAAECESLLAQLDAAPASRQHSCLVRRLHDGLEYIWRRGSAESLDEQLKHLAELDGDRVHASYGLFRLIVWAIPILGFLGTVIGITMAIASLKPSALEESMLEVTAGLGVAFDTTALALALVTILMFLQFYVDRAESALLAEVDRRVDAELLGRFPQVPSGPEGELVALRRMSETMIQSLEQLVRRQAELWRSTMEGAQQRWTQMAEGAGHQLQVAFSGALGDGLKANAQHVAEARRFEETVTGLAAAIHLLNAKLGATASGIPLPHLEPHRRAGQAA